jgi:hypothetical protein
VRAGALAALALALALAAAAPAGAAGPALEVPAAQLDQALSCPNGVGQPNREPVLLVHGTGTDSADTWDWNHIPVLSGLGYDVCFVELPDRALGDAQVSTEYVVHAVRAIRAGSGREVDVIGHSQGTLEPRWAMKWWPDVAEAVDDYVSLAGVGHGVASAESLCATGSCFPAAWQMGRGSRFLTALNRGDETPGRGDHTVIYSQSDELVQPFQTSALQGASNVLIQDVCPGRVVQHGQIVGDPVAFRVTLDALSNPGPGDPARAGAAEACTELNIPGGGDPVSGNFRLYSNAAAAIGEYPVVTEEPALKPYARAGAGGRARLRLRVRPRVVRAGRRRVFRFRVRSAGRPVAGARVRFAGKKAKTGPRGRARIVRRFRSPRRARARAAKAGMSRGTVVVRVRRA